MDNNNLRTAHFNQEIDLDDNFLKDYINDKDDKINRHNIMYEIVVIIGHSDYDSKIEVNKPKSDVKNEKDNFYDKTDVNTSQSSTVGNQSTISEMKEKPLDLFKHIDPDIDPTNDKTVEEDDKDETVNIKADGIKSFINQTITDKLGAKDKSLNRSSIIVDEPKDKKDQDDQYNFNFDKIDPDDRWLSDFNRVSGDLIKYSFENLNMNSFLQDNTKLVIFN